MELIRLLEIVLDTELQLCVIGRKRLHLVQRDQHFLEKIHVLGLEWRRQTGSDRGQNLE